MIQLVFYCFSFLNERAWSSLITALKILLFTLEEVEARRLSQLVMYVQTSRGCPALGGWYT